MLYSIMRLSVRDTRHLFIDLWNNYYSANIEMCLSFRNSQQMHRMTAYLQPNVKTGGLVSEVEIYQQYNMIMKGKDYEDNQSSL